MKSISKYYIGFGVLVLLVLCLVMYIVVQAGNRKVDLKTQQRVVQVTDSIEEYANKHKSFPSSLEEAGVTKKYSSIKYKKISNEKFELCIKYRANGGGDSLSSIVAEEARYTVDPNYYMSDSRYSSYYLSLNNRYNKGWNCETIEEYSSAYDNTAEQVDQNGFSTENLQILTDIANVCSASGVVDTHYHACMRNAYDTYR